MKTAQLGVSFVEQPDADARHIESIRRDDHGPPKGVFQTGRSGSGKLHQGRLEL